MQTTPTPDPLAELARRPDKGVLAVITGVEGPSYRPVGAMMAVFGPDERVGSLSSGCIEADIALHAMRARNEGRPLKLRYGIGSPFMDIRLPCGGGLDILLLPRPDAEVLERAVQMAAARRPALLRIDAGTGAISLAEPGEAAATGWEGDRFRVLLLPEIFFYVFGKGPEAATFARLVQSAEYPNLLLSPDAETLASCADFGCAVRHLKTAGFPSDLRPDPWSAVVLFFHDHEWEPPILAGALGHPAFYIGAQGSRQAGERRDAALARLVPDPDSRARVLGPIGLVPSARDPRTLAISVMAEVLALGGGAPRR